jgi:DNA-binding NarL/FixJ family response regulator
VVIADDHEVVRTGLKSVLGAEADMEVVGEAADAQEAVALTLELKPDVVLIDIHMPGQGGLCALGRIRLESESTPILVFSNCDHLSAVAHAADLGANGYLRKTAEHSELHDAVRRVAAGMSLWTREELRQVTRVLSTSGASGEMEIPLTPREIDVLRQLSHGLTNKEIAQALGISSETVKEHVQHILRKVGVVDRTQAAVWAVRKGLV